MQIVLIVVAVILLALVLILGIWYRVEITAAWKRVRTGSRILKTPLGEIEYAVQGEGQPALVLHGAGGGYDQGLFLGRNSLGEGYKLISVSRFGYLNSPIPKDSTLEAQAAIYAELLNHLGITQPVIVMGGSAGGLSAMRFAHDYPEKCAALVFVSAVSMYMYDNISPSSNTVWAIQKHSFIYWLVTKLLRTQFIEMIGVTKEAFAKLSLEEQATTIEMLDLMHPSKPRLPGTLHEINIRTLSEQEMGEISVPTIILHAKDDKLVGFAHAEYLHKIRNSELIPFDTAGHSLISRTVIIGYIRDFLTKNRISAAKQRY